MIKYQATPTLERDDTMAMTPEELATNADFLLIGLAEAVATAEKQVADQMASANRVLDSAIQRVQSGRSLNSLGELQATGMAVDCKVAHLEQSVKAFEMAWRYLGNGFPFRGNPQQTQDSVVAWFDATVEKSPRLQEIYRDSQVGKR